MLLSICIPTFNRPLHLANCLNSLYQQKNVGKKDFEICISDNCSKYNILKIIKPFKKKLNINYQKNKKNIGFAMNVLKVSLMAKGKFIWFLGDDDLVIKNSITYLTKLIKANSKIDFFFINSFYLDKAYLDSFPKPFNIKFLPKNMKTHSPLKKNKRSSFFDLIDHRVCFDYLLGFYVNAFRRDLWNKNLNVIDKKMMKVSGTWSTFDNTCFFIKIVRLPEALDYYRSKGLNLWQYIYTKNYSLRNFFNYFFKILIGGEKRGLNYINFKNHFFKNLIYPNAWLSVFYFIARKVKLSIIK